jgi:hypothetical protein
MSGLVGGFASRRYLPGWALLRAGVVPLVLRAGMPITVKKLECSWQAGELEYISME